MTGEQAERRVLVVWNPSAGSKAGVPTNLVDETTLRETLRRHGLGDDVFVGEDEDAVRHRVADAVRDGYEVVVAAGGDGTAGLVARELLGTTSALALLPLGSAMNIARSLDIPRDLDEAAAIVASGEIREIDVGESDGHVFFEIASIGLSAAIFAEAQRIDRGRYSSLLDLVRVVVRCRPTRVLLTVDGTSSTMHALMLAVANTPYTGLGLTLAPAASVDDGAFDVTVFRGFSRWELILHLGAIAAGRRRYSPKVATFRGTRISVEARRPLPVRADADDLGTTPATFVVRPRSLRVIAPARSPLALA